MPRGDTERAYRSFRLIRILTGLLFLPAAGGCEMTTAGSNLFAMAASPAITVPVSDAEAVPDFQMHIHGHWCGTKYPTDEQRSSGFDLTPVDLLDAACMKHDLCYRDHGGKPACWCDKEFIWRLKYLQYHGRDFSPDMRLKTFVMLSWFETSKCFSTAPDDGAAQAAYPEPREWE